MSVFAYVKSRFSHDAAQFKQQLVNQNLCNTIKALDNNKSMRYFAFLIQKQLKHIHKYNVHVACLEESPFCKRAAPDIDPLIQHKKCPSSTDSRRASCQLLVKEWTLNTDKLPPGVFAGVVK